MARFGKLWLCILQISILTIIENLCVQAEADPMAAYRLPNSTIPRFYKIKVEPNMNHNFSWTGESSIDIEVLVATKSLTLHAHSSVMIDEKFTKLVDKSGRKYEPIGYSRDNETEFYIVDFNRPIDVGNYTLALKYAGVDEIGGGVGFFLANQTDQPPNFAATKFEATYARLAFPCWDEPALKAHFQISIEHYPNYTALSNMPEKEHVKKKNGKTLTTFHKTPPMSTYLVNFVIGFYESVSNEYENVTVWTTESVLDDVQYVVPLSQQVADVMESYTELSYGVPRIGSVTIPVYPSEAAEHWGLISYSDDILSMNRSILKTTEINYKELAVAHEMAHGWFGNRVSSLWWNDIWLSEAFAQYYQYHIVDEMYVNWGGLDMIIVDNNQEWSFPEDDSGTNLYVRYEPTSDYDINNVLFGVITYKKGASIIHMFRNALTDDIFHAGIRKYLKKYSFKAADAEDLTSALQEAYDEYFGTKRPFNVNDAMMTWLMQSGYPMINVTRNYTTGEITVVQNDLISRDSDKRWWIPLSFATEANPDFSCTAPVQWISDKQDGVTIDGSDPNGWVVFNLQANGYYRVNYDEENWDRLVKYLNTDNFNNINELNRAQLIDDSYYLWKSESSKYSKTWWELTKYLERETDYSPWYTTKRKYATIQLALFGSDVLETFQNYTCSLMNSLTDKSGYETNDDDDNLTKLSKQLFVGWACTLGHSGCVKYSTKRILLYIKDPSGHRLHPDNKMPILCAGLWGLNGTATRWVCDWFFENDKETLDSAIGCVNNWTFDKEYLIGEIQRNSTSIPTIIDSILQYRNKFYDQVIDFILEYNVTLEKMFNSTNQPNGFYDIVEEIYFSTGSESEVEKFSELYKLDVVKDNKRIQQGNFLQLAQERVPTSNRVVANVKTWLGTEMHYYTR